jgi:redox-sensitive bicupin YhaK (pirin superfamily)
MTEPRYQAIEIDEMPTLEYDGQPEAVDWHPLRIHFGISSFGVNAFTAREAGQAVIVEHTETDESGTRHEELYYVTRGRAKFTIAGEGVDAPAGTLVYVPDPSVMRTAEAEEPNTTVLCFGGTPGQAFSVSPWEQQYDPANRS